MKKIYLLTVLTFLLQSCQPTNQKFLFEVFEKVDNIPKLDSEEFTTFVIIPNSGCSSCISKAKYVLKNELFGPESFFIFKGLNSNKEVKLAFGDHILSTEQFYIDSDGIFNQGILNSPYPIVITDQGKSLNFITVEEDTLW